MVSFGKEQRTLKIIETWVGITCIGRRLGIFSLALVRGTDALVASLAKLIEFFQRLLEFFLLSKVSELIGEGVVGRDISRIEANGCAKFCDSGLAVPLLGFYLADIVVHEWVIWIAPQHSLKGFQCFFVLLALGIVDKSQRVVCV